MATQVDRPTRKGKSSAQGPELAAYFFVAISAVVILVIVMHLWQADLHVLLTYEHMGDTTGVIADVKTTLENGTYRENCRLAAPGCQYYYDYAVVDTLHFHAIAWLASLLGNLFLAYNLYYLAGPALTSLTALYVLRALGISRLSAVCCSILYAFVPAYFFRGTAHLSYALYALCPFCLLFCRWILHAADDKPMVSYEAGHMRLQRNRLILAGVVCVLLGWTNIYYAFFFCVLFITSAAIALIRRPNWNALITTAILTGIIAVTVGVNLLPNTLFAWRYGANPEAAGRNFNDAEIYGLKISQLVLPVTSHRIGILAAIKDVYSSREPLVNENDFSSLGIVGSVGFILLIAWIVVRPRMEFRLRPLIADISSLNLISVLLGTIGGFGALLALVLQQIRSYNRISIFISLFSLAAIAVLFDNVRPLVKNAYLAALWPLGLAVLTIGGLYDEIPKRVVPLYGGAPEEFYKAGADEFASDGGFVSQIEALLPRGAMVFQAPNVIFPETGSMFRMADYDHFKEYLLSNNIHWSFGALRGRWESVWLQQVGKLPASQLLMHLCLAGFRGIEVDRFAYGDNGAALEASLQSLIGPPSILSKDGRYTFYDLAAYGSQMKSQFGAEQWNRASQAEMATVFVHPGEGMGALESDSQHNRRWSGPKSSIVLYNRLSEAHVVDLEMSIYPGNGEPANFFVEYPGGKDAIQIVPGGTNYRRSITVPPGRWVMRLRTDGKPLQMPADPRVLSFRMEDLRVHRTNSPNVTVKWGEGYSEDGRDAAGNTWRWSTAKAVMVVTNNSGQPEAVMVSGSFATGGTESANLTISGLVDDKLRINSMPTFWKKSVTVPPGTHSLVFSCDAKQSADAGDQGRKVFMTKNFQVSSLYPEDGFSVLN